ncbi:MAG: PaaI family thioesterase [Pseudomonadota bacterium]
MEPILPAGARPDPDHAGWFTWGELPADSFAAQTGPMIFRPTEPGRAVVRMFPEPRHMNFGGSIHGGAVMSFIDMALFSGGFCAGMARGHYVTLDLATRFIARGQSGIPLDAHIRLLKQTPGGLVFIDGHCEQEGAICYSFSGSLKRIKSRSETGDVAASDAERR